MVKKAEKEVEETKVTLEQGKQHKLKTLSKILQVFAIIGSVGLYIGVVAILICAVVIPFIMKDVKISKSEISYKNQIVEIRENDEDYIELYYKDKKITTIDEVNKETIYKYLDKYSANKITIIVETALVLSIISFIIMIVAFKYAINLFKNINEQDTPFIEENVTLLRKLGKTLIVLLVVEVIGSGIMSVVAINVLDFDLNFTSLGAIFMVFMMGYIFEHGCKLQEQTKLKIYD